MVTSSSSKLKDPPNIACLGIAFILLPAFVFWVSRQERLGRPAIIPNSLWRNRVFTCICIVVFFSWAVFNAFQYFLTLFFQEVQDLSAIQTSVRFLPMVVSGCLTNAGTGLLVPRIPANWLIFISSAITAVSPLLMANINKDWPFWYVAFPATLLSPISADVLFTVSNLLITSVFPSKTHGLAGGVFNTLSQIGNSIGLALTAIIASTITIKSALEDKKSPDALLQGYKATFWACFAATIAMLGVSGWGLRRIGKVGLKTE
jgi:nitrate/nitrite transporter NarK